MKIALIDPSLFTWPYDSALIKGLRSAGHAVNLYTKYLGNKETGKNQPGVIEIFYPFFNAAWTKRLPTPIFLALKGLMHPFSMLMLFFRLRREKPDIIHFQWAPLPVFDLMLISLFRTIAPVVFTAHDSAPFNNSPRASIQRSGAVNIMRQFDAVIVHTEKAKNRVASYHVPIEKIHHIEHGLLAFPPTMFVPIRPKDQRVSILLFGQLKPYKGIDILMRAVAAMPFATREKCRIDIIGRPQMPMQPLFDLAQELGIKDSVYFDLRFVPDDEIKSLATRADILVFPYREIDASGVLMLFLPLGKPILASRMGLFEEILPESALVTASDPAALATSLAAFIENPALRLKAGGTIEKLAMSIPTWDVIAHKTASLYQTLIDPHTANSECAYHTGTDSGYH